jgi:SPP1 family predicted phage head-tail adaptor
MLKHPLNKTITIQVGVSGTTTLMSPEQTYDDYMTTYASVYNRSGVTKYDQNEDIAYTTEFTIRYNSLSKEINNEYRVMYNEKKYAIIEIIEVEYRKFIKIIAQHYGNK